MIQIKPRRELEFGYAYDYTTSRFAGTNSGSHEVMLRYEPYASKIKPKAAQVRGAKKKPFGIKGSYKKVQAKKRKKVAQRNRLIGRR
jgi:hypothetical protein